MIPKTLNRQTASLPSIPPERIIQFGGGNFLRAFIDWMVDLMNERTDFNGSAVVVKPRPSGSYEDLRTQDGLFHVRLAGVQAGQHVQTTRLVSSISRVVNPYQDMASYLQLAEVPTIRFIVSNTTEAGIEFVPTDQLQDTPALSFPAKLTQFLYHRYQHFSGDPQYGCIMLPCELIEQNGVRLREIILQYANLWQLDDGFVNWIQDANIFCNTLVDRIVSGFPGETAFEEIGYMDPLLVDGEVYHNWVIEGDIQNEFPSMQAGLNVKFTTDLSPDRNMKVRILNGAHIAMAIVGYLMGLETVGDFMANPVSAAFVQGLIDEEILPFVAIAPAERERFAQDTLDRFRNPFLHHQLLSITLNALPKFPVRLLPSFDDYRQQHQQLPERIIFVLAAMIRFYKGDWHGNLVPLRDDANFIEFFDQLWKQYEIPELAIEALKNDHIWGRDLSQVEGLTQKVTDYLVRLDNHPIADIFQAEGWYSQHPAD